MSKKKHQEHLISNIDGFPILGAQPWYFAKLGIIQSYIKAYHDRFDLRNKNKMLLYIGAGPGMSRDLHREITQPGTPLAILANQQKFNRYIFCEKNPEYANALKIRVGKNHPKENVVIIEGDINRTIEKIPPYLPERISGTSTSILCIIDLQSFDLHFETIEILAAMEVDLLLVNSFVHSDYYNYKFYLEEEREPLNAYFGSSWAKFAELAELSSDNSFFMLVIKAYLEKIKQLGYNVTGALHKYNLEEALVPYYQIAYCSKSKALSTLKKQAIKENNKQTELFK